MDWIQVLTIVGANIVLIAACIGTTISMFLWARSEAREDQADLSMKLDNQRKEANDLIKAIHEEMKDFHNRLIILEERTSQSIYK